MLTKFALASILSFLPNLSMMYTQNTEKSISYSENEAVSAIGGSLYMLIGTYTQGKSNGIYVYRFDEETGNSAYVSEIEAANPTYLTISSDEKYDLS